MEINSQSVSQDRSAEELLLERARGGDVDAFGKLVQQYQQRVFAFVIGVTGESATADEITQEVFLAAFQKLDRFTGQSEFSTWLMGIAKNQALSSLRSQIARRQREKTAGLQRLAEWKYQRLHDTSNEQWNDNIETLRRCLGKLKPEHRRLLDRHYRDNETTESIGKDVGRSGSAVRMLFLRLRKSLQDCMQRESNE